MKAFSRKPRGTAAPHSTQQLPAVPESDKAQVVQAAQAIAAAINQGLPGNAFCRMMHAMDKAPVKEAAGRTAEEVEQYFYESAEAKQILSAAPRFPDFIREFHDEARRMYPQLGLVQ